MSLERLMTTKAPKAIGPYSQAVRAGEMVFLSGQIPLDPATGEVVPGGIREQAAQVMKNFQSIVEAAGATMADVAKTTIFMKDLSGFNDLNDVYGRFFDGDYPARSCVEVSRLPKDVLVEIEGILIVKK